LKRFALLLTVICVLMLHFPAQIFAASASLTDPYDFLLPEEKQDLAMMASAVSDTHGLDVIMAVELTENGLLNTAADYYYENLHSHAERAVVLVIDPEYADMALKAYGTAANIKLALIPTVAICRHWSKKKNLRIRNELVRELQTEIKICEEKINDANMREDKDEKYRLMRIRDRLDAEMIRVKTNSKYV